VGKSQLLGQLGKSQLLGQLGKSQLLCKSQLSKSQ
jgi:hypothetical protein